MRVVVTGATGNVGTSLVQALATDPQVTEIVGLARRVPRSPSPPADYRAVDIGHDPLGPHFIDADVVVHLAWLFQPTHRPTVTWDANVLGSARVFKAITEHQVPVLVYASSVGAYSPAPDDDKPVDESWPTHALPTAAYGREKSYVERLLDGFEHEHSNVRVVRLRPGFIFKRASATEQRRLFAGSFVPTPLLKRGRLPLLPLPAGLRFQALHTADAADAYVKAVTSDVRGAFNIAAEPVLRAADLGRILGGRPVSLPPAAMRMLVAAGWHAHVVPTDPNLLDLVLSLPIMNTTRAMRELGWRPRRSGTDALVEMLDGLVAGAGGPTPPLAHDSLEHRLEEIRSGVGERP